MIHFRFNKEALPVFERPESGPSNKAAAMYPCRVSAVMGLDVTELKIDSKEDVEPLIMSESISTDFS